MIDPAPFFLDTAFVQYVCIFKQLKRNAYKRRRLRWKQNRSCGCFGINVL